MVPVRRLVDVVVEFFGQDFLKDVDSLRVLRFPPTEDQLRTVMT
jgi:hypothetical protein